ncbi:MAG: VanW family protein [Armatimonadota bacterium]
MARKLEMASLAAFAAALVGIALYAISLRADHRVVLAEYATTLRGRSATQKHNAALAARALDGRVIQPERAFSYNEAVGPWTADRGYKRAPVSYDGELLMAWGGGVCQTSTTLYNAAMLAGLEVVERHRHAWPPRYVAPGRDAAVAYPTIDLVLRNPYPWPVRLSVGVRGDSLVARVLGRENLPAAISVREELRSVVRPDDVLVVGDGEGDHRVVSRGHFGFDVAVYRTFRRDGRLLRCELISADHYPARNRVVMVGR